MNKLKPLKFNLLNQGFGLIEVMISLALMVIVSIGVTTMLTNMQKEQRRNTLIQVLSTKKMQFESMITNSTAWAHTLTLNGGVVGDNTHCLLNQTTCSSTTVKTWTGSYAVDYEELVLRNNLVTAPLPAQLIFYDGTGADGAKQGFKESGESCNTFTTAAAGNDDCPIGYRVSWAPQSDTVINPKITVLVKMIYNPSDANSFKKFFNAPATSTDINPKYDVQIDRTAMSTSKSFSVSYTKALAAGTCADYGFGACPAAYQAFGDGLGGTRVVTDPFDLVNDESVSPEIRLRYSGYYKCNAKSYAFATDGAYMQLYRTNNTAAVIAGPVSTMASQTQEGYSTLIMDVSFQVNQNDTDIVMQQKCDSIPVGKAACALGFANGIATAEIATLNCILID